MLPKALLAVDVAGGRVVPRFLTAADHLWLRHLLQAAEATRGRPVCELKERLAGELPHPAPQAKRKMSAHVLAGLVGLEPVPKDPRPTDLRRKLFRLAQETRDRDLAPDGAVLRAGLGRSLGLSAAEVDSRLFADLPGARLVGSGVLPGVDELALQVNLALVQGLLRCANELTIELHGGAHAVVRQVRLRRLICTVEGLPEGARLHLSGAYALFRRTRLYGNRLASLVPALGRCERWSLEATVFWHGEPHELRLCQSDPVLPTARGPGCDSKVERWFERDFAKHAPGWQVVREPAPLKAGTRLVFPDFQLQAPDGRRHLVEIVGFWTPTYLERKLRALQQFEERIVLCVDEALACEDAELPVDWPVVRYKRRVDVSAVLRAVEQAPVAEPPVPLGPRDLFIDFAGRQPPGAAVHRALQQLVSGAGLSLDRRGDQVVLLHGDVVVAVLSRRAAREWRERAELPRPARVTRLATWRAEQSHPRWRWRLAVEQWSLPCVEVSVGAVCSSVCPGQGSSPATAMHPSTTRLQ